MACTRRHIDRNEPIDGAEHDGDRADRTEYLPGRIGELLRLSRPPLPSMQNRLRRSNLELRRSKSGLKIGLRSS
eukprot:7523110-Alexandrium_andersonii.AAC.1